MQHPGPLYYFKINDTFINKKVSSTGFISKDHFFQDQSYTEPFLHKDDPFTTYAKLSEKVKFLTSL